MSRRRGKPLLQLNPLNPVQTNPLLKGGLQPMARERSKNREENQSVEPQRRGQLSRMENWPAFSPFGMMRRFADEMDRMFEGFGFPSLERRTQAGFSEHFSPEVDIFERDGKLVV